MVDNVWWLKIIYFWPISSAHLDIQTSAFSKMHWLHPWDESSFVCSEGFSVHSLKSVLSIPVLDSPQCNWILKHSVGLPVGLRQSASVPQNPEENKHMLTSNMNHTRTTLFEKLVNKRTVNDRSFILSDMDLLVELLLKKPQHIVP